MHPSDNQRQEEPRRLEIEAPGLSAWQRFCPQDAWRESPLLGIEQYLSEPATRELFDQHEETEIYPRGILERLLELGLADILVPGGEAGRSTVYHMCGLNALAARRDTSVAVTLSVNILGLLPAYIAADPGQIDAISRRVQNGSFSSLLLTELPHGSNILRNEAQRRSGGPWTSDGAFRARSSDDQTVHPLPAGRRETPDQRRHPNTGPDVRLPADTPLRRPRPELGGRGAHGGAG